MQATLAESRPEITDSTQSSASSNNFETESSNQDNRQNLQRKKERLTEEIINYKKQKKQELNWARRLNRGSIGMALVLTAATTICSSYDDDKIQKLAMPLGTLAVTLNGWIASVPMSKRVSLYERTLVKADNLRSDLEFKVEAEKNIEEIRESFKSMKVEFIQENPGEQYKANTAQSRAKA